MGSCNGIAHSPNLCSLVSPVRTAYSSRPMYLADSLPVKHRSFVSRTPPNFMGIVHQPLPTMVRLTTRM